MTRFYHLCLLLFLFAGCSRDDKPFLVEYSLSHRTIGYKLTHDSLVIIFPENPGQNVFDAGASVFVNDQEYYYELHGLSRLRNNRIKIPLEIPDTVALDSQLVFIWLTPMDGMNFVKRERQKYDAYYSFITYRSDWAKNPNEMVLVDKSFDTIYYLPDTYFTGEDSAYYHNRFEEFLKADFLGSENEKNVHLSRARSMKSLLRNRVFNE